MFISKIKFIKNIITPFLQLKFLEPYFFLIFLDQVYPRIIETGSNNPVDMRVLKRGYCRVEVVNLFSKHIKQATIHLLS